MHTKLANGRRNDTDGNKREEVKESDGNREEKLKAPMETPKRAEAAADCSSRSSSVTSAGSGVRNDTAEKKKVVVNYMFTKDTSSPTRSRLSSSSKKESRLMEDKQNTSLRVVDPMADEGVWAIVDDACNCNCHGERWRINAEEKIRAKGFKCIHE